jgi:hypothetical protein
MNTTNLKTFSDFQKQIIVTDWCCGKDGIDINYEYNGKELSLLPSVASAVKMLEFIGAIEEAGFENDTWFVSVEIELQGAKPKAVWIEYEQFLLTYNFSQSEAIDCAAYHEGEKQMQTILSNRKNAA